MAYSCRDHRGSLYGPISSWAAPRPRTPFEQSYRYRKLPTEALARRYSTNERTVRKWRSRLSELVGASKWAKPRRWLKLCGCCWRRGSGRDASGPRAWVHDLQRHDRPAIQTTRRLPLMQLPDVMPCANASLTHFHLSQLRPTRTVSHVPYRLSCKASRSRRATVRRRWSCRRSLKRWFRVSKRGVHGTQEGFDRARRVTEYRDAADIAPRHSFSISTTSGRVRWQCRLRPNIGGLHWSCQVRRPQSPVSIRGGLRGSG